ncbi:MAG: TonB C-terminal domain-containing protein [Thermodesulfobacteriota bacterium]
MKDRFTDFFNDLAIFLADLKQLCNRQTAHDAFVGYWEGVNRDSYRKIPLILTVAVHLGALLISALAPFLISSTTKIPEVYTVDLYQVMETAPSPPQQGKKVKVAPPVTKKPVVAAKPVKPDAVSLSPIREKLAQERKEKEYQKKQQELLDQKMEEIRLGLEEAKAEQEARDAAAEATSKIAEMYKSTSNIDKEVRKGQPTGEKAPGSGATGGGEVDPRELAASARYTARLFEHISPHWQLPELQNWDENLRAVIVLRVKRDGTVTNTHFEKRSRSLRFNQYVQKAIDSAQPLPPFPLDLRQKSEEIAVTFSPGGLM